MSTDPLAPPLTPEPPDPTKSVEIVRWPELEHRFSAKSPMHVAFERTPLNLEFGERPLNMNLHANSSLGVSFLGSKEPVALTFVVQKPIVATSDYTIKLRINGADVFSISVAGTTTIHHGP